MARTRFASSSTYAQERLLISAQMVKCWDLEANKVIRHYHGHLSGVYALSLHPTLDVLVTSGRDASARVWDMRTKAQIHVLAGHTATVADVKCQESDPQVITGSMDSTVRCVHERSARASAHTHTRPYTGYGILLPARQWSHSRITKSPCALLRFILLSTPLPRHRRAATTSRNGSAQRACSFSTSADTTLSSTPSP